MNLNKIKKHIIENRCKCELSKCDAWVWKIIIIKLLLFNIPSTVEIKN